MGPVKAALESSVRYLAHELGPKGIRVNAISAGAVRTRAASGIEHFDELIRETETKSPLRRTVTADEVGRAAVLRETSTVFAALVGWLILGEKVGARRAVLMAVIAAGAMIVEFAA